MEQSSNFESFQMSIAFGVFAGHFRVFLVPYSFFLFEKICYIFWESISDHVHIYENLVQKNHICENSFFRLRILIRGLENMVVITHTHRKPWKVSDRSWHNLILVWRRYRYSVNIYGCFFGDWKDLYINHVNISKRKTPSGREKQKFPSESNKKIENKISHILHKKTPRNCLLFMWQIQNQGKWFAQGHV